MRARGKIQYAARALDVNVARLLQRVVETHRSGTVNNAGRFCRKIFIRGTIQPASRLAHISGIGLNAGTFRFRNNRIAALFNRLAGAVAEQKRQFCLRLTFEQFAHQLSPEKPGSAGYKDEFFFVHRETGLASQAIQRGLCSFDPSPKRFGCSRSARVDTETACRLLARLLSIPVGMVSRCFPNDSSTSC